MGRTGLLFRISNFCRRTMFGTIPNKAHVQEIEYHPLFSVICSVGKAPFHGVIDIVFQPGEVLLEFESFDNWLREIANDHMTIEDLTRIVFDGLTACLGEIPLSVTVHAKTTVHAPASAKIERK